MNGKPEMDLIVLVPGKDESAALDAMFARSRAIGIRPLRYKIDRHEERDAGCRLKSPLYLKSAITQFDHAIVMFDREGCGAERPPRDELEKDLESRLASSGWGDRAAAIVIDPELENWIWSDSPRVDDALGWKGRDPPLRQWLAAQRMLAEGQTKPPRPEEATTAAMKKVMKRRSSDVYAQIASHVSLTRCADPAFLKLLKVRRGWFKE